MTDCRPRHISFVEQSILQQNNMYLKMHGATQLVWSLPPFWTQKSARWLALVNSGEFQIESSPKPNPMLKHCKYLFPLYELIHRFVLNNRFWSNISQFYMLAWRIHSVRFLFWVIVCLKVSKLDNVSFLMLSVHSRSLSYDYISRDAATSAIITSGLQ